MEQHGGLRIGRPALRSPAAIVVLALAVGWAGSAVGAEDDSGQRDCVGAVEPNDTPETALPVEAPGCASGDLLEGDLADHVAWTLDPDQAGQRWIVSFSSREGTPAVLRMSSVASDPSSPTVTLGATVTELRSVEGTDASVRSPELLLSPGRYLFSVTPGGPWSGTPTSYRLDVESGSPLPSSGDREPNDDPATAVPVVGAFEVSGDAAGSLDHFAWNVDETGAPGLWTVEAQGAIGTTIALSVSDADGVVLGDVLPEADGTARLPDLGLDPGTYTIRLSGPVDGSAPYVLRAATEDLPTADREPNDDAAGALTITPGELVAGRLARHSDLDGYRLTVDGTLGSLLLDARLIVQSGPPRKLCLSRLDDGAGTTQAPVELSCDEGEGVARLTGLLLEAADYILVVSGVSSLLDPYYLRVDTSTPPQAGYETEPNDTPSLATAMTADTTLAGRLDNPDHVRVHVEGEPQLWQVEARGPDVRLVWERTDGAALGVGADPEGSGGRSVLNDVYLIPGDHWFRLDGTGEYLLELTPLGPPVPGGEREPNDELSLAESLPMDGTVTGRIGTAADTDVFGLSLAATEHVGIRLEPPPEATLWLYPDGGTAAIATGRVAPGPGQAIDLDLVLPAGDHAFRVVGAPTRERYRISLSRRDPFDLGADQEPNDRVALARPMPPSLHVDGTIEAGDEADWYRLDPLPAGGELRLETRGVRSLSIHDGMAEAALSADGEEGVFRTPPQPAGAAIALGIVADGAYAVTVEPGATGLQAIPAPAESALPVEMALSSAVPEVAAFDLLGQEVVADLSLVNTGARQLDLRLDAVTSDPEWRVVFDSPEISLAASASTQVPVTIRVPAQAWSDHPVRITVRARDGEGQGTAFTEITPRTDADSVAPFRWWSIPEELLGGLDAAATALGAMPLVSIDPVAEAALHDGVIALGGGMDLPVPAPLALTVDLAGEEPVPVAGTILDPSAGPGAVAGTVRDFELLLSEDGVTYQAALHGTLSGALGEQAFVLPAPIPARFAQLRIRSVQPGSDHLRLGEWKVVATPGWQPSAEPLDLAEPALGGRVAWLDPQPSSTASLDGMLDEETPLPDWLGFDAEQTDRFTWVLGFQDGRAAQVDTLQWQDPTGSDPSIRLARLDVASSMVGPLGPWTPLGTWDLERDASGVVAPFALDDQTWTRYLRFSARVPDRATAVAELPGALRVLERQPSEAYRSVAGEWGYGSSSGPFEWQQPADVDRQGTTGADGATREADSDTPLVPGVPVRGRVARALGGDGYMFSVPQGAATVRVSVSGQPTVGVGLELVDEGGTEVPMTFRPGTRPGTVDHEAVVVPGGRYRLLVEQPPFSAVVVYDTSASISQYLPIMAAALRSYSRGIVPGVEAIQLLDLEGPPVPDEFSDDGWLIQNALDAQAGSRTGSSGVEIGLLDALDLLSGREGARAILLLTDAESASFHRSTELWRWLGLIGPQIFATHVGGPSTPLLNQRLMQDWAAVGGGFYEYARSGAAIARAFDRMAAWLRRPVDYGLQLEFAAEPPATPEPGSLRVVSDAAEPPGAGSTGAELPRTRPSSDVAIELVLDTSGSMSKRLGRERRIDVAKEVLARLVTERLDPGTPVALRVFRPERRSCESDLAVPLGPLEPTTMAATIAALDAERTVRTPLAAAIAAVASDLAAVEGPRIVVVVSDGRESCGGDPEAAVQTLVDAGFDVSVNVVGLGLDRKARRQIGRLAEIGNGTYYDAQDADGLAAALRRALGAPYVVVDASGAEVGRGTVDGPPVELAPGAYRVALVGAPGSLDAVIVESGAQETVRLHRGPGA